MRKRYLFFLLLIMITIILHHAPKPAQAANSNGWASWVLDVNFAHDQTNATMTITVEFADPNIPTITQIVPLNCTNWGNLKIKNERAEFSGNEYITCDMPDLVAKVHEITKGRLAISPHCDCEDDPWAQALLTIDPNTQQTEPINPIFYHPDLQFSAPFSSKGGASLSLAVNTQSAHSELFPIRAGVDIPVWAQFTETLPGSYKPNFTADGIPSPATPSMVYGPFSFSNQATTIYIGYLPRAGIYFEGTLNSLQVDPACRGYG